MTARDFWKEKFEEYPQTDSDKLAVVMMAEYARENPLFWKDINSIEPDRNELVLVIDCVGNFTLSRLCSNDFPANATFWASLTNPYNT